MKIEEGHLLKFIPPILDGNSYGNKKRYMLVINCDIDNFNDLQKFMSFNGTKISNSEISNIKLQRYNYIKNYNPTNVINYSETDFKKFNFINI